MFQSSFCAPAPIRSAKSWLQPPRKISTMEITCSSTSIFSAGARSIVIICFLILKSTLPLIQPTPSPRMMPSVARAIGSEWRHCHEAYRLTNGTRCQGKGHRVNGLVIGKQYARQAAIVLLLAARSSYGAFVSIKKLYLVSSSCRSMSQTPLRQSLTLHFNVKPASQSAYLWLHDVEVRCL